MFVLNFFLSVCVCFVLFSFPFLMPEMTKTKWIQTLAVIKAMIMIAIKVRLER